VAEAARDPEPNQSYAAEMFGVLVPSTISDGQGQSVEATTGEEQHIPYQGYHVNPTSILGAGRVNPFAQYPIEMDLHMHGLVDHSKRAVNAILSTRGGIDMAHRPTVSNHFHWLASTDSLDLCSP